MADEEEKKEDRPFHIKYKIETGEFTREEIKSDPTQGGCDALVLISIAKGPIPFMGSMSQVLLSRDGYTGDPLESKEMFRTWILMAQQILNEHGDKLPEWQRNILRETMAHFRTLMDILEHGPKPGGTPPAQA